MKYFPIFFIVLFLGCSNGIQSKKYKALKPIPISTLSQSHFQTNNANTTNIYVLDTDGKIRKIPVIIPKESPKQSEKPIKSSKSAPITPSLQPIIEKPKIIVPNNGAVNQDFIIQPVGLLNFEPITPPKETDNTKLYWYYGIIGTLITVWFLNQKHKNRLKTSNKKINLSKYLKN
jgi:hypothetical protein